MVETFQSLSHSRWDCKYHVVFVPKRRRKTLFGTIRRKLGPMFHELARQKECRIVEGHGNVRQQSLGRAAGPQMYVSYRQQPAASMTIVLRARDSSVFLGPILRALVGEVDSQQPLHEVRTMEGVIDDSVRGARLSAQLLGGFAVYAVMLAGLGIFGVMSYAVSLRTKEIGVRLAIGATPGEVRQMVLREGVGFALVGVAVGASLAVAFSRTVTSMLFPVEALDPATFISAIAACLLAAFAANYLPARRASRIDPAETLRQE